IGASRAELAKKYRIEEILIALPSASGHEMTRILKYCHEAEVNCRTIPALGEIIDGRKLSAQIRDVHVDDLLGRKPVNLGEDDIRAKLNGRVVMVTGAAGSIGSELCRQIARFNPRSIVGYEISETACFYLEREMRERFPKVA